MNRTNALSVCEEYLHQVWCMKNMKSCGCKFCNDLRNIEPAKYIGGGDENLQKFLKKATNAKQFIYHFKEGEDTVFAIVDKCPKCKYEFTEEDYDNYL